jgi:hypothetical protein
MKKTLLLIFAAFLSLTASAQRVIPGYMGKRFTVGFTEMFSPNFYGIYSTPSPGPVFSHSLGINYVITKQTELCLAGRFYNRNIADVYYSPSARNDVNYLFKMSTLEYSFGFRRFYRSKFAPLGGYTKWEFMYLKGAVKYDPYQEYQYDYNTQTNITISKSGGKGSLHGFGASFSKGRQRVFEDKLVVDFGFRATLMAMTATRDGSDGHGEDLASTAAASVTFVPIANVFLGLGFLAF